MDKNRFVQITRQNKIAEEEFSSVINAMYEQIWQNLLPPQILTDDLTTKAANNSVTLAGAPVPDCMTCGACCAALPCVGVRPDEQISAEDYWDVMAKSENGEMTVDRFLRRDAETFVCTALDGAVGEKVICRIYEQRPRMCHDFEAGSDKCHALRRAYGLEPFLTLEEMFAATQKLKNNTPPPAPAETVRRVKFVEQAGTLNWQIQVFLKDGSAQTIHTFNPNNETWRQFEFDGLTLSQAKDLVNSRKSGEADSDL